MDILERVINAAAAGGVGAIGVIAIFWPLIWLKSKLKARAKARKEGRWHDYARKQREQDETAR